MATTPNLSLEPLINKLYICVGAGQSIHACAEAVQMHGPLFLFLVEKLATIIILTLCKTLQPVPLIYKLVIHPPGC